MSWWNPWGEVRRLRTELARTSAARDRLFNEQARLATKFDNLGAQYRTLSVTCNDLIREKNDLRNQLRQAHVRDPKTGRIRKRGAL